MELGDNGENRVTELAKVSTELVRVRSLNSPKSISTSLLESMYSINHSTSVLPCTSPWMHMKLARQALREILFHNGNLTLALVGWWRCRWAGSGCGGSGLAPGWCGWAVSSLLRSCCGGAVCWRPAISLPVKSVIVGEVGQCVGVRWRAVVCVGVLRTGPVAAGVRVYSSVSHL